MSKFSSRDREIIRNIVIKYASQERDAGFWKSLLQSAPLAIVLTGAAAKDVQAAESGLTTIDLRVGASDGHVGIIAGPSFVLDALGEHPGDTSAPARTHTVDPIGGSHHLMDHIRGLAKKLFGKGAMDTKGDLLTEKEIMQKLQAQVAVAQRELEGSKSLALNIKKPEEAPAPKSKPAPAPQLALGNPGATKTTMS